MIDHAKALGFTVRKSDWMDETETGEQVARTTWDYYAPCGGEGDVFYDTEAEAWQGAVDHLAYLLATRQGLQP
jgi:hypothetical protein